MIYLSPLGGVENFSGQTHRGAKIKAFGFHLAKEKFLSMLEVSDMAAYYNENDPYAAQWLRNLVSEKLIADGVVDDRSIKEVRPEDLAGFTQCHFFAGIGGWSRALRLAGWTDDRPVWTGSCPCQPFSSAGKGAGFADERHLWPAWFHLIRECRPDVVFGEQVAAAVAHGWLDLAFDDLEAEDYATAATVLPACSVGAPHKRDRLWFVADTKGARSGRAIGASSEAVGRSATRDGLQPRRTSNECSAMAHARNKRRNREPVLLWKEQGKDIEAPRNGKSSMANTDNAGLQRQRRFEREHDAQRRQEPLGHHWARGVHIDCPDGKARLVEPSIPLLAHGVPSRVGRLRAYGNAIVPPLAAEFIGAFMEDSDGIR